jgi:NADH dehydrogenase [ubiquinone] 1 alpha subcomplex assembly factor 7
MPDHNSKLLELIRSQIAESGPMPIDSYWEICLSHPEHGYYKRQDPFGRSGDFITAPEISQMFGEMVGIWCACAWSAWGRPEKIYLAECGPGRGTLMADLLRGIQHIEGFPQAVRVHLVETSPVLRAKQKEVLAWADPLWHDDFEHLPQDAPVLFIGNEFLDALPIRQFVKGKENWQERLVGLDDRGSLRFVVGEEVSFDREGEEGSIAEVSPARQAVMEEIYERILHQRGAALMIDYGYISSANGDTFQAVRKHGYAPVLESSGDADLTSHVDFDVLAQAAREKGLSALLSDQGDFLRAMGIEIRTAALLQQAREDQKESITSGFSRLTGDAQMGRLFKVLEVSHE